MSDTTTTAGYLRRTGEWILLGGLPVIVESIAYTVVLACFTSLLVIQRDRRRRRRSHLVSIFSVMFTLVSLEYAINLFYFFIQAREILLQAVGDEGRITPAEKALQLDSKEYVHVLTVVGNGCWLSSTMLGDVVVFWRAWELSSRNVIAKRILVCAGVVLLSHIGASCAYSQRQQLSHSYLRDVLARQPYFSGVCGKKALINWCLSVLSNLLSTCVIAYIGWSHRIEMRKLFQSARRRSTAEKILGLLAESGFIYFSVNVICLIIFVVTPTTYSIGDVIATVCIPIVAFAGASIPMATQVTVYIYGSLWDRMLENSSLPTRNNALTSIRFVGASGASSVVSLESAESIVSVQDTTKEMANPNN